MYKEFCVGVSKQKTVLYKPSRTASVQQFYIE